MKLYASLIILLYIYIIFSYILVILTNDYRFFSIILLFNFNLITYFIIFKDNFNYKPETCFDENYNIIYPSSFIYDNELPFTTLCIGLNLTLGSVCFVINCFIILLMYYK